MEQNNTIVLNLNTEYLNPDSLIVNVVNMLRENNYQCFFEGFDIGITPIIMVNNEKYCLRQDVAAHGSCICQQVVLRKTDDEIIKTSRSLNDKTEKIKENLS